MRLGPACLLLLSALGACAPTTGPTALPVEVLVLLDRQEHSLRLIAVDSTDAVRTIDLGAGIRPTTLAVQGTTALVGLGDSTAVLVVDLGTRQVLRTVPAAGVAPVAAVALGDNGVGYAVTPATGSGNNVTRFFVGSGEGGVDFAPGGPQGFAAARGTIYLVLGNRQLCYPVVPTCLDTPSWLKPIDRINTTDSIPLLGPGNAAATTTAPDGLLYVLNSGNGGSVEGRLSAVDPVRRQEVASFGGFGLAPMFLASDGGDRLLIASAREGLMVFDIGDRQVERGAGNGIPLAAAPVALVADARGRTYVVEQGGCGAGGSGRVQVFGTDLVERRSLATGVCPVAAAITQIPADRFHVEP